MASEGPRSDAPGGGRPRDGYGGGYSNRASDGRGYPSERRGPRGRDNDRDYYGRGRGRDRSSSWRRENDDVESWRCQECGTFNDYGSHSSCKRCGARESRSSYSGRRRSESPPYERRQRSVSESSSGGGDGYRFNRPHGHRSDDKDYYGPASSSESRRRKEDTFNLKDRKRLKVENKSKAEEPCWPPPFEKDGASYIFDARSGFFYEMASDFFFDPKTKLYYGNKQRSYFQHCPGERPPYRMVSHQPQQDQPHVAFEGAVALAAGGPLVANSVPEAEKSTASASTVSPAAPLPAQAKGGSGGASKKKIAISLKSKQPLVGSSPSAVIATEKAKIISDTILAKEKAKEEAKYARAAEIRKQKEHESDMAKWSERQRESQGKDKVEAPQAKTTPAGTPSQSILSPSPKVTTKKGEPICFLCKRKFANIEKLRQHEQVSALHKQNLAKKMTADAKATKKNSSSTTSATSTEYRDRAKDRRVLYGPDPSSCDSHKQDGPLELGPSLEKARAVTTTEVVKPDDILGDSNIGSKMLLKLGWKKGASLGRKQDSGLESSSNPEDAEGHPARLEGSNKVKKDWEKIESIASGNRVMAHAGIGDSGKEGHAYYGHG